MKKHFVLILALAGAYGVVQVAGQGPGGQAAAAGPFTASKPTRDARRIKRTAPVAIMPI